MTIEDYEPIDIKTQEDAWLVMYWADNEGKNPTRKQLEEYKIGRELGNWASDLPPGDPPDWLDEE